MNRQEQGFAQSDINFIAQNDIYGQEALAFLRATKDNYDPKSCLDHRRFQEDLRDNHNHLSDQYTWNKNNKVVHTYYPPGMKK